MEDVDKLIADVNRQDWGGHSHVSEERKEVLKLLNCIKWFVEKTTNEYLGRATSQVLKSIKTDNPPELYRNALLKAELAKKNRKKVVEALNDNEQ